MQTNLADYDSRRDDVFITALEKGSKLAELENIAVQAALSSHVITKLVLGVDFQSTMYPAISDTYVSLLELMGIKKFKNRNVSKARMVSESVPYVYWSLPGRITDSAVCGVHRSDCGDLPVTVCSSGTNDYLKARAMHCWRLRCKTCMNAAALRKSVQMEQKVIAPVDIHKRKTGTEIQFKHWSISPPQEWLKKIIQRADHFQLFYDDLLGLLQLYGFAGGCVVFHPWRLLDDNSLWEFSPHFHAVGYGFFENMKMRNDLAYLDSLFCVWGDDGLGESWVFKQIHPGEKMRSVRYTFAYILTHAGLGKFSYDNNWDIDAEDLIIPAEYSGIKKSVKCEGLRAHNMLRTDEQLWHESYSDFDFLSWSKERCVADLPVHRYFGSSNQTRILGVYADRRVRVCPECGAALVRKNSLHSCVSVPADYVHTSKIRVQRSDFDSVSDFWRANRDVYESDGFSVLDFSLTLPQCSSPESSGLTVHRPSESIEERASKHNQVLVYLWAKDDIGLDPVIMTKDELAELRRTGDIYSPIYDPDDRDLSAGRVTIRKPPMLLNFPYF